MERGSVRRTIGEQAECDAIACQLRRAVLNCPCQCILAGYVNFAFSLRVDLAPCDVEDPYVCNT